MSENNLTEFEAQELLRQYSSDLRKLEFQLQQTKLAINHLQGAKAPSSKGSKLKKEVSIIDSKVETQTDAEIKIKRYKKSSEKPVKVKLAKDSSSKKATAGSKGSGKKGRNPITTLWDAVITNEIGTKEIPTTSQDLLQKLIHAREKQYIPDEGNTKLIQRLNASLTKLFKQKKIGKEKIEGKKAFVYYKIGD
ncbi:MAG: hypothetical protein EBS35_00630 [Bacteroidetes bacterium]|nr:hypothetical protein [Bacteroidota bacterium]